MTSIGSRYTITVRQYPVEKPLLMLPANVYSLVFIHKERTAWLAGGDDNVNHFIVMAQTPAEAQRFVEMWFVEMDMPIPIEKYNIDISLSMADILVPKLGVISGVYRW